MRRQLNLTEEQYAAVVGSLNSVPVYDPGGEQIGYLRFTRLSGKVSIEELRKRDHHPDRMFLSDEVFEHIVWLEKYMAK